MSIMISLRTSFPLSCIILMNVLTMTSTLKGIQGVNVPVNLMPKSSPPEIRVLKWVSSVESDYDYEQGLDQNHERDWDWDRIEDSDKADTQQFSKTDAIHVSGFGSHEYIISQHVTAVLFECRAPYPVQWIFDNAYLVTEDLSGIQMRTFRHSRSVTDPKNDVFTATLEISVESNRATGNYSCRSASQHGQMSNNVFIYWEGPGSSPPFLVLSGKVVEIQAKLSDGFVTIPCYLSNPTVPVSLLKDTDGTGKFQEYKGSTMGNHKVTVDFDPKVGFQLAFQNVSDVTGRYRCETNGDDEYDLMEALVRQGNGVTCKGNECFQRKVSSGSRFYFDEKTEELVCCGRKGNNTKSTKMHIIFCGNPSVCGMFEPALYMSSGNNGKRSTDENCVSERIYPRDFGLARCKGDGIDVLTYFYTEFWTPEQENLRAVFDWSEVNPQNMVHLMIHTSAPYYNLQKVTATCQTLHSYFSDGIKWAIKWKNESLTYFDSVVSTQTNPRLHGTRSAYVRLHSLMTELICYAPVWNSTSWIEKSLKIDVKPSKIPVIKGTSIEELTFALNDTEKILECVSIAQPPAKIKWTMNDQTVPRNMVIWNENGTSVLLFKTISHQTHATYKCIAMNEVGQATKLFRIFVEDTRHSTWSLAFAIVIPVVVIVFLLILGFMLWRMKLQKKVVDHLTRVVFRDSNNF